ncbi:hypothetical protein Ddc_04572 [Ditylenchus destructor]|nr:hypothetical protein Ddc_04572 [Ditylenchus destructor]
MAVVPDQRYEFDILLKLADPTIAIEEKAQYMLADFINFMRHNLFRGYIYRSDHSRLPRPMYMSAMNIDPALQPAAYADLSKKMNAYDGTCNEAYRPVPIIPYSNSTEYFWIHEYFTKLRLDLGESEHGPPNVLTDDLLEVSRNLIVPIYIEWKRAVDSTEVTPLPRYLAKDNETVEEFERIEELLDGANNRKGYDLLHRQILELKKRIWSYERRLRMDMPVNAGMKRGRYPSENQYQMGKQNGYTPKYPDQAIRNNYPLNYRNFPEFGPTQFPQNRIHHLYNQHGHQPRHWNMNTGNHGWTQNPNNRPNSNGWGHSGQLPQRQVPTRQNSWPGLSPSRSYGWPPEQGFQRRRKRNPNAFAPADFQDPFHLNYVDSEEPVRQTSRPSYMKRTRSGPADLGHNYDPVDEETPSEWEEGLDDDSEDDETKSLDEQLHMPPDPNAQSKIKYPQKWVDRYGRKPLVNVYRSIMSMRLRRMMELLSYYATRLFCVPKICQLRCIDSNERNCNLLNGERKVQIGCAIHDQIQNHMNAPLYPIAPIGHTSCIKNNDFCPRTALTSGDDDIVCDRTDFLCTELYPLKPIPHRLAAKAVPLLTKTLRPMARARQGLSKLFNPQYNNQYSQHNAQPGRWSP